jgi:hypothetical protein
MRFASPAALAASDLLLDVYTSKVLADVALGSRTSPTSRTSTTLRSWTFDGLFVSLSVV